jgi:hypothetical protein
MPKVGWGAVVLGDTTDLDGWAHALKEQFDPWVETHGTDTVLRSASLDELDSAMVRDRSTTLIERLNGAMALSRGSKPVRFGGVIQFAPDSRLHRTIFAEMFVEETPDEVHIIAVVSGPDGKPLPPPPPRPSEVQHWSVLADNEDLLNDALIYFGRATDWFDIYKTLECLEKFGLVQPDFYYERDGIPGVCIFIDGPQHDEPAQAERDRTVREALKDQGFRVVAIKSGRAIADQVSEHLDIFRRQ